MSLRAQPAPPAVPNRCQLFGPGSRPAVFAKMAASAADVVNLDLEASVPPAEKPQAREHVARALGDVDWGRKTVSVRINGLGTPWWHRDVIALIEAGGRLDRIMVPDVGSAADLHAVDALVTALEAEAARAAPVALEGVIGSAAGLARVGEIAAASPRLEALSLAGDALAESMGALGASTSWEWAAATMVTACRAHGVLPVDGPHVDFEDDEGFAARAAHATALGMVGKWAIHPRQVAPANEAFTPPREAVARARAVLAATRAAQGRGEGATIHEGRLVDPAAIRRAEGLVRQADAMEAP